ncbi:MAG TPA: hypothetical protein VFI96_08975 [Longimicrobiaceae bacterium]|nr:hypothetical protein [Longimicrobiaceae bacterium]
MAVGDNQDEVMDGDDVQVMLTDGRLKPADPDLGYSNSGTEVIYRADYEQGIRHVDMSASGIASNEPMTYGEMIAYRSLAPLPQEVTPGLLVSDTSANNFDYTLQCQVSNPADADAAWTVQIWRADGQMGQETSSYQMIAAPACAGASTSQYYNDKPVMYAQYYTYQVRYADSSGNVGPYSSKRTARATATPKQPG